MNDGPLLVLWAHWAHTFHLSHDSKPEAFPELDGEADAGLLKALFDYVVKFILVGLGELALLRLGGAGLPVRAELPFAVVPRHPWRCRTTRK